MAFRDPVVSGTTLVRNAIASPNFVAGVSGWIIRRDGSCEFNNAVFRGNIVIGSNPGNHIASNIGGAGTGIAAFGFYSGLATEINPAYIYCSNDNQPTHDPVFLMQAANMGNGALAIILESQTPPSNPNGQIPGGLIVSTNGTTVTPGLDGVNAIMQLNADIVLRLLNTNSVFTGDSALRIGLLNAQNLQVSNLEIQSLINGAAAALQLQPGGGNLVLGTGQIQAPGSGSAWATSPLLLGSPTGTGLIGSGFGFDAGFNGTLNQPLYLNNNSSKGIASSPMRQGFMGFDTTGRTTTSTTYAAVNGTTDAFTVTAPPSGYLTLSLSALLSIAPLSASKKGNLSFEIRDGTSAGAVLWGASDIFSIQLWDNECTEGPVTRSATWQINAGAASTGTYWIRPMFKVSAVTSTLTSANTTCGATPSL